MTAPSKSVDFKRSSTASSLAPSPEAKEGKLSTECIVRNTVRRTDLYHIIQVHLGLIDKFTLTPSRGLPIAAKPRQWLTIKDLQEAFYPCRVRLNAAQAVELIGLVVAFNETSKDTFEGMPDDVVLNDFDSSEATKVSSAWIKRYFIHQRVAKSGLRRSTSGLPLEGDAPMAWAAWVGAQTQAEIQAHIDRPNVFRRALSGQPHKLSDSEVAKLIEKERLLTPEQLNKEVSLRVKSWLFDHHGTRDFQHKLNLEIRRHEKENATTPKKMSKEERAGLVAAMKERLVNEMTYGLIKAEETSGAVSKELFFKFSAENKSKGKKMEGCLPWNVWILSRHVRLERDSDK